MAWRRPRHSEHTWQPYSLLQWVLVQNGPDIYIYISPRMSVQEFNGHSVIFSCFLQGNGRKTRVAYSFICLFSINLWKCPWQVFFRSICAYLPAARCIENPYGCIVKYQCKQHLLIHKHPWGIHVPGSRFGGPQNFLPPA